MTVSSKLPDGSATVTKSDRPSPFVSTPTIAPASVVPVIVVLSGFPSPSVSGPLTTTSLTTKIGASVSPTLAKSLPVPD